MESAVERIRISNCFALTGNEDIPTVLQRAGAGLGVTLESQSLPDRVDEVLTWIPGGGRTTRRSRCLLLGKYNLKMPMFY
eukprot:SAG22_NODE_2268_length_2769_cov_1.823970_5_plen_80_part_00